MRFNTLSCSLCALTAVQALSGCDDTNPLLSFRPEGRDGREGEGEGEGEGTPLCTWSTIRSEALDSLPAGAIVRNGLHQGQGVGVAGGRMAWVQTSDWNQLFVPAGAEAGDDVLAATVDHRVPTSSGWGVGAMNESSQYNDVLQGFWFGYDRTTHEIVGNLHAPVGNRSTCCSSPTPEIFRVPPPLPLTFDEWHTVRVEFSRARGVVRIFIDGVWVVTWQGDVSWLGNHISLHGGAAAAWTSANVAFSNLRIERGSSGCLADGT